ncbi:MAG: hypothetical protein JNK82_42085, partial [Myxococcaceae bacterium]|nr:hypothetical protein [Myxococcaceae bacterium]
MRYWFVAVVVVAVVAPEWSPSSGTRAPTTIQMEFTRALGFFTAPFPNEDLRKVDGHIDLSRFPGRGGASIIDAALAQLEADARGFSTTAGIFFAATARLDARSLPQTAKDSLDDDASVYLVDLERKQRVPIHVEVREEGGRFGAPNLVTLVPYQGVPLREATLYVAVITTRVRDAAGKKLEPAPALKLLEAGVAPVGVGTAAFLEMKRALPVADDAVAIAVFRTDAPRRGLEAVRDAMAGEHPKLNAPLTHTETYETFCVFESTVDLPQYQEGTPPFADRGGRWVFDAAGAPVRQRYDRAGLTVTVPRTPMPAGGYPVVVFTLAGMGGGRALVDRGYMGADRRLTRGSGPALEFARAGFAAVKVDGPHTGLRNVTHGDEQFLMFNWDNPQAIRDNVRQSAAELTMLPALLDALTLDGSACGLRRDVKLDGAKVALFGHSMGATIAPLAMAFQPRFEAAVLSGSGGSFIANLMHKQKPFPVRPMAELLLGYSVRLYTLTEGDPALSLVQWALEPADPPVYGALAKGHVLMLQGVVDHYILPPMANASSLALGLDLAGDELDVRDARLKAFAPFRDVAAFSGRGVRSFPVAGNVRRDDGTAVTAAVVQNPGDAL